MTTEDCEFRLATTASTGGELRTDAVSTLLSVLFALVLSGAFGRDRSAPWIEMETQSIIDCKMDASVATAWLALQRLWLPAYKAVHYAQGV